jgi:predicted lipoprotein with Yx(FWY)xxD motif
VTRRTFIIFLASAATLAFAVLAVAGCGGSSASGSVAPPTTMNGRPATFGVASGDLGEILVNSQGRTRYRFQRDSVTKSACTSACASDWPPLRSHGTPTVGSGADASMVATSARSDGRQQVTYSGHPLSSSRATRSPATRTAKVSRLSVAAGSPYLPQATRSRALRRTRAEARATELFEAAARLTSALKRP